MRCLEWEVCAGGAALALAAGFVWLAVAHPKRNAMEAEASDVSLEITELQDGGEAQWNARFLQSVDDDAKGTAVRGNQRGIAVIPHQEVGKRQLERIWRFMAENDGVPFKPCQAEKGAFRWEIDQELYNAGAEPDGTRWVVRIDEKNRRGTIRVMQQGGQERVVPLDDVLDSSERLGPMLFLKVENGKEHGDVLLKLLWMADKDSPLPAGMVLRMMLPGVKMTRLDGDDCISEGMADGCAVKKIVMDPEQLEAMMLNVSMNVEADNLADVMNGISANVRIIDENGGYVQLEAMR